MLDGLLQQLAQDPNPGRARQELVLEGEKLPQYLAAAQAVASQLLSATNVYFGGHRAFLSGRRLYAVNFTHQLFGADATSDGQNPVEAARSVNFNPAETDARFGSDKQFDKRELDQLVYGLVSAIPTAGDTADDGQLIVKVTSELVVASYIAEDSVHGLKVDTTTEVTVGGYRGLGFKFSQLKSGYMSPLNKDGSLGEVTANPERQYDMDVLGALLKHDNNIRTAQVLPVSVIPLALMRAITSSLDKRVAEFGTSRPDYSGLQL